MLEAIELGLCGSFIESSSRDFFVTGWRGLLRRCFPDISRASELSEESDSPVDSDDVFSWSNLRRLWLGGAACLFGRYIAAIIFPVLPSKRLVSSVSWRQGCPNGIRQLKKNRFVIPSSNISVSHDISTSCVAPCKDFVVGDEVQ